MNISIYDQEWTGTMTPTEQNKELREQLWWLKYGEAPDSDTLRNLDHYPTAYRGFFDFEAKAMQLITADRKRVELKARIDENEAWYALGRMIDPREFVAEIGRLELKKQEEV